MRLGLATAILFAAVLQVPGPAAGDEQEAPVLRKVGAGLHDGDLFGPRLRPDGAWIAYGVREQQQGTFKTSYYARELEGGIFHSIWPTYSGFCTTILPFTFWS